jgi:hypothetical protein
LLRAPPAVLRTFANGRDDDEDAEAVLDPLACLLCILDASTDIGTDPPGVAIFTVRSTSPGGVGGDAEDAGDVDSEREDAGVSGVSGEVGGEG